MSNLDSKQLPEYLKVNVRHLRKCPNCNSKNYVRGMENMQFTKVLNGEVERWSNYQDAGSTWQCLECNLYILQDGKWEFMK